VLAVAARTGRLGSVVIDDGALIIWDTSEKAASSEALAAKKLRSWVKEFRPDCLVTENPDTAGQKRGAQIPILKSFAAVGDDLPILNLVVTRKRLFKNAYLEAENFGNQFPDIAHLAPKKPAIWEREPYQLVCFEALALVRDAGLLAPPNAEIDENV